MRATRLIRIFAALLAVAVVGRTHADVRLPAIISDGMVLQKAANVPIWGTADAGEEITVTLDGQSVRATAGADGRWKTALDLGKSGPGPFEMIVEGKNRIAVRDVVVGEVWFASGQSNMEWSLKDTTGAQAEIASSANPFLRQFLVKKHLSPVRQEDTEGRWVAADPATAGGFSAVGYYLGKKLQQTLKVPVGLVHASWGGTPSEIWTSVESIDTVPELKASRERIWKLVQEHPDKKAAFVEGMDAWIKAHGREDRPVKDATAYAGIEVSTEGWVPVKLPGEIKVPGIPEAGAVWLRKEVEVPESKTRGKLALRLPLDGFDQVYWNGERVAGTDYKEFAGLGHTRMWGDYDILPAKLKPGKNILAIRLYQPVGPAVFTGPPKAGPMDLSGEWLAREEYAFPALDADALASAPQPPTNPPTRPPIAAGYLFNGMVAPVIPYALRGVIWYQGESNIGRAWQYRTAFPLLINDWRKQWGRGDFPFYFCQLANHKEKKSDPGESSYAELREAQSMALALPNTGQAVLIDIGEADDIHPRNKKDVGERLARIALARDYDKPVPFSGPVFDSMKIADGKAIIRFRHADGGLVATPLPETYDVRTETGETAPLVRNSPQSELEGFALCGEDKKWVWADARIEGDSVVVWSAQVPSPVAVRYAWADNPTCNLSNAAGLPAAPFRTDNFPPVTLDARY